MFCCDLEGADSVCFEVCLILTEGLKAPHGAGGAGLGAAGIRAVWILPKEVLEEALLRTYGQGMLARPSWLISDLPRSDSGSSSGFTFSWDIPRGSAAGREQWHGDTPPHHTPQCMSYQSAL